MMEFWEERREGRERSIEIDLEVKDWEEKVKIHLILTLLLLHSGPYIGRGGPLTL